MSRQREVSDVAKEAAESRPVRILGRVGLAAYGLVHLLISYLALRVAFGGSDEANTDKSGALATLAAQPGGRIALGAIALVMVALIVWRVQTAGWGHRRFHGAKRTFKRLADAGRVVIYAVLGSSAAKLAFGGQPGSAGDRQTFTAKVLALPFGQVLVVLVGLGTVAGAGYLVYHGLAKKFLEDLDLSGASPQVRTAVIRLGQVSYPIVAVAYGIVGVLIVVAAVQYDPEKATGLDVALKTLVSQPYGPWLLAVVALGFAGFGLYRLFDARYHRD